MEDCEGSIWITLMIAVTGLVSAYTEFDLFPEITLYSPEPPIHWVPKTTYHGRDENGRPIVTNERIFFTLQRENDCAVSIR